MSAIRNESDVILRCDAHEYLTLERCPKRFTASNRVDATSGEYPGRRLRKIGDLRRIAEAGADWRATRRGRHLVDLCPDHAYLASPTEVKA